MLKAAAAPVLLQKGIPKVLWAGVSGDLTTGEENDYSELDVIVLYDSDEVRLECWPRPTPPIFESYL